MPQSITITAWIHPDHERPVSLAKALCAHAGLSLKQAKAVVDAFVAHGPTTVALADDVDVENLVEHARIIGVRVERG